MPNSSVGFNGRGGEEEEEEEEEEEQESRQVAVNVLDENLLTAAGWDLIVVAEFQSAECVDVSGEWPNGER
jgi:hypothetical protein